LSNCQGDERLLNADGSASTSADFLTGLVYELLDAHGDTMSLACDLAESPAWAAHLDYLRGLQRVGREALARVSGPVR
jgi:hypothetical protein